ncbi:MAG: hypothetical protein HZB16_13055 [Armatimonadetes bacterium]|nr:hypothetical protein [Armatimonadota bacterium]
MFGRPKPEAAPPLAISAAERAKIMGRGLVQVVVTQTEPLEFIVLINEKVIPQDQVGSLFVSIEAPSDAAPDGTVQATLEYLVDTIGGQAAMQRVELFPCTLVLLAAGRRVAITASSAGSLDGMWINLGLKPDGSSHEVSGAQALSVIVQDPLLQAKITWNDGREEDLIPVA